MATARAWLVGALLFPSVGLAEDRWHGAAEPYLGQARERIHRRWAGFVRELPRAGAQYQDSKLAVELELTVEPDGAISRVVRTRGSGLAGFDDAPLDLVRDVGRLPPPPPALFSDDGKAHLRWRFARK